MPKRAERNVKWERIRNFRVDNDLTQQEVADYLYVGQTTYSQYENGVINYPLDVVIRLAQFYNTSVDFLLNLTDNPAPPKSKKRHWQPF